MKQLTPFQGLMGFVLLILINLFFGLLLWASRDSWILKGLAIVFIVSMAYPTFWGNEHKTSSYKYAKWSLILYAIIWAVVFLFN